MKTQQFKQPFLFFGIFVLFLFASCSSNETKKEETPATESQPASSLMEEGPVYDATKIDPDAPVISLTLKATGNTMTEMKYDLPELHVKEGCTVKLVLINTGTDAAMQHNFVLIEKGSADKVGPESLKAGLENNYIPKMKQVLVYTALTQPGKSAEVIFPAPSKGEYDFICTYPGHYTIMNGKFFVE